MRRWSVCGIVSASGRCAAGSGTEQPARLVVRAAKPWRRSDWRVGCATCCAVGCPPVVSSSTLAPSRSSAGTRAPAGTGCPARRREHHPRPSRNCGEQLYGSCCDRYRLQFLQADAVYVDDRVSAVAGLGWSICPRRVAVAEQCGCNRSFLRWFRRSETRSTPGSPRQRPVVAGARSVWYAHGVLARWRRKAGIWDNGRRASPRWPG